MREKLLREEEDITPTFTAPRLEFDGQTKVTAGQLDRQPVTKPPRKQASRVLLCGAKVSRGSYNSYFKLNLCFCLYNVFAQFLYHLLWKGDKLV